MSAPGRTATPSATPAPARRPGAARPRTRSAARGPGPEVGRHGDGHRDGDEREAARAADAVARGTPVVDWSFPSTPLSAGDAAAGGTGDGPSAERRPPPTALRRHEVGPPVPVGASRPLDRSTRSDMEARFGVDFSTVRIHDDATGARRAGELGAEAFTQGTDIVFGAGRYQPRSAPGRHLLAHELAHVVQQSRPGEGPRVQRRGIGEWIGVFLGLEEGNWSDAELTGYLAKVTKAGAVEGSFDSDNKARAIVGRWKRHDPAFALTTDQRVLLIREMLDGPTLIDDERAIVDLLAGSTPDEGVRLLGPGGVTLAEVESDVDDKAERARLDAWVASSFDGGRDAVLAGRVVRTTRAQDFAEMTAGTLAEKDTATAFRLPVELIDALAAAWSTSFPGTKSKEQGGLLVRKADGSLDWVRATRTTSGTTTLPFDKVPRGATPIVGAHTHPYSAAEGGFTGVAFSGGDIGNLVSQPLPLKVVYAGTRIFAIAKTTEFEAAVAAAPSREKFRKAIIADYDAAQSAASGDLPAQALEAVKAVCRKYHLALYEGGVDGSLTKLELGP